MLPTCKTCKHFKTSIGENRQMVSVCKAFPPTPIAIPIQQGGTVGMALQAVFPPVNEGERCGQHDPVPVKLAN